MRLVRVVRAAYLASFCAVCCGFVVACSAPAPEPVTVVVPARAAEPAPGSPEWIEAHDSQWGGSQIWGAAGPDRDKDAVNDDNDRCPDSPEDRDGFQDDDGCPDPDNDQDGVADLADSCPNNPGPPSSNGCPTAAKADRDHDGVADANDMCPDQAEDMDGFQDQDGCPDPDNDGDGILDVDDECVDSPETMNGYRDQDGCPDKKP